MAIEPLWIWIAVGAVALIVVAALIARGSRKARTAQLRNQFGAEYDHAVSETGKRKRAEQELLARVDEVKKYDIRAFTVAERDRFRNDWALIERRFLERPTTAVVEADELVAEMMRVRGYPIGDFERHAKDLSVTHPRIVEHYRAGHRAIGGAPGNTSTEDLRQAMLHYRALFDELVSDVRDDVPRDVAPVSEVRPSPPRPGHRGPRDEDRIPPGTSR